MARSFITDTAPGLNICARSRSGSPRPRAELTQTDAQNTAGRQKLVARSKQVTAIGDGFVVCDVRCRAEERAWSPPEVAQGYVLVFVRQGSFCRRVNRAERFMDPVSAYFETPGGEQQIAHPGPGGDACTTIELSADLAGILADGEPARIGRPNLTPAATALAVQLITRQARHADRFELAETITRLVGAAISGSSPLPSRPRAATKTAWRRLVEGTRQILSCDPGASLHDLACRQSVSPHHLSRVFHASTGMTISAYRNQLRVRAALERLADGERSLTSLAADLGFADHAHMARTVRRETGAAPSVLRRLLATGNPPKTAVW
jgi:AraC-like DNA-binding protein